MGNCCACQSKPVDPMVAQDINPSAKNRPAPPLPDPDAKDAVILRALYDYKKQMDDDMSFKKGDFLELVEKPSDQWWIAFNTKTGERGYVPVNYVRVEDDTPQSQDCWFEIQRRDAERMLLAPGSSLGQFIVRPSAKPNCFALSVRDQDQQRGIATVKHYLIRIMDHERGYYIAAMHQFKLFKELIEHYQKQQDGLCRRLTEPAPRVYTPPPFREFEVDRRCVQFGLRLGAGCFGEVYQAKFNDVMDVAVKTLKPGTMSTDKFIKEAQIMHQLYHPKIVRLLGVCTKAEPVYIIAELMPNGALLNYLQNHATARDLTFADQIDMAAQISDGMAYLEDQRLVHRDLRAANILVGENNEVKISDFGLTTLLEDEVYTPDENAKFPVRWTAPEAMFHRQFSIKSDVWSFGVLIYEIITYGRQPYPGLSNREVMDLVQAGQCMKNPHNQIAGINCPEPLYEDIMKNCWKYDANKRPTFHYLHETLDNFDTATGRQYDDQPMPTQPPKQVAPAPIATLQSQKRTPPVQGPPRDSKPTPIKPERNFEPGQPIKRPFQMQQQQNDQASRPPIAPKPSSPFAATGNSRPYRRQ